MNKLVILIVAIFSLASSVQAATMTFDSLVPESTVTEHTENGLTMDATLDPPSYGPIAMLGGLLHFDNGSLFFDMAGASFTLDAINFRGVFSPESDILVTTNTGFTADIPTPADDLVDFIYLFDSTYFSSITSFTLKSEIDYSCVQLNSITFSPENDPTHGTVPEPSTLILLSTGIVAVVSRRRRRIV